MKDWDHISPAHRLYIRSWAVHECYCPEEKWNSRYMGTSGAEVLNQSFSSALCGADGDNTGDDKSISESSAGLNQNVHPIRKQTTSSLLQVLVQESWSTRSILQRWHIDNIPMTIYQYTSILTILASRKFGLTIQRMWVSVPLGNFLYILLYNLVYMIYGARSSSFVEMGPTRVSNSAYSKRWKLVSFILYFYIYRSFHCFWKCFSYSFFFCTHPEIGRILTWVIYEYVLLPPCPPLLTQLQSDFHFHHFHNIILQSL